MNSSVTVAPTSTRPTTATPAPSAAGPRLLAGWYETGAPAGLAEHHRRYGPLPLPDRPGRSDRLIEELTAACLRGRGGAGFPTARKLAAVAAGHRRPVVVANGCEGEPASRKDAALLSLAPHLVLDGGVLAAHALGASEVILCVHQGAPAARTLPPVIAERDDPVPVRLVTVPPRYVASGESALIHFLTTGDARPTTTPPRASQRGVNAAPTLVDNVETLAHLALIACFGASWFRSTGTPQLPGTLLITLGGAIRRPGVYEVPAGTTLGAALQGGGGPATPVPAVLVGGYAGNWLAMPQAMDTPLSHEGLHSAGAALGVAALLALPHSLRARPDRAPAALPRRPIRETMRALHLRAPRDRHRPHRDRGRPPQRHHRTPAPPPPARGNTRARGVRPPRRCRPAHRQRATSLHRRSTPPSPRPTLPRRTRLTPVPSPERALTWLDTAQDPYYGSIPSPATRTDSAPNYSPNTSPSANGATPSCAPARYPPPCCHSPTRR
jgi:hypothetical protein